MKPMVSSRGAVSYETAKELARILKPLVGKSPYHVHNSRDFVQQIKCIQLQQDECNISYDVKALFTSVSIGPTINIIKEHPEQDKELQQRTTMTVNNIICLLEFCLKNTYFLFQDRYYKQLGEPVMGSILSPIVAYLYMEDFEPKAVSTSPHPPSLWKWYLDGIFVVSNQHTEAAFWSISTL